MIFCRLPRASAAAMARTTPTCEYRRFLSEPDIWLSTQGDANKRSEQVKREVWWPEQYRGETERALEPSFSCPDHKQVKHVGWCSKHHTRTTNRLWPLFHMCILQSYSAPRVFGSMLITGVLSLFVFFVFFFKGGGVQKNFLLKPADDTRVLQHFSLAFSTFVTAILELFRNAVSHADSHRLFKLPLNRCYVVELPHKVPSSSSSSSSTFVAILCALAVPHDVWLEYNNSHWFLKNSAPQWLQSLQIPINPDRISSFYANLATHLFMFLNTEF